MLMARCVATAALERQESRGGHTRDDYPGMRPEWRKVNLVCTLEGDEIIITRQPTPRMRDDLIALFDPNELKKYMTEEEVAARPPLATASPTGDAVAYRSCHRGDALMAYKAALRSPGAATVARATSPTTRSRSTRARSSSMSCTGCTKPW